MPLSWGDPDGRDYFDPNWAKEWHVEGESAARSLAVWLFQAIANAMSGWGGWMVNNRKTNSDIGVGAGAAGSLLAVAAGIRAYASVERSPIQRIVHCS